MKCCCCHTIQIKTDAKFFLENLIPALFSKFMLTISHLSLKVFIPIKRAYMLAVPLLLVMQSVYVRHWRFFYSYIFKSVHFLIIVSSSLIIQITLVFAVVLIAYCVSMVNENEW